MGKKEKARGTIGVEERCVKKQERFTKRLVVSDKICVIMLDNGDRIRRKKYGRKNAKGRRVLFTIS